MRPLVRKMTKKEIVAWVESIVGDREIVLWHEVEEDSKYHYWHTLIRSTRREQIDVPGRPV